MTDATGLALPEPEIAAICRRYQVRELCVFGSAARGEMRPDSDIDLLVDFLPEARLGLIGLSAMMREFSGLLGRRVDLAVKPALSQWCARACWPTPTLSMRRDLQRLQDILEALDSVTTMMGGCSEAEFLQNDTLRYAVAHRLTVVGEAAARLGADIREKYASVPWVDWVGLRWGGCATSSYMSTSEFTGLWSFRPRPMVCPVSGVPSLRSTVIEMIATEFPE